LGELVETALYQKSKKRLNLKLQMNFKENQSKALPYLIPVIFIVSVILTSFGIHQPADVDVIFYYNAGYEILHGDASNVYVSNGGIGWPVTLAFFTDYVGDVLIASKSIALIASGLIIFITFFIIRNVLGSISSALIGQAFLAINPFIHLDAIITNNDMLPLLFIFLGAYVLSKKDSAKKYLLIGLFLGISFWFRYQCIFILFGIIIYLLISNQTIRFTAKKIFILSALFMLVITPMLVYNYSIHGVLLDVDPSLYLEVYGSETDKKMWADFFVEKVTTNPGNTNLIDKVIFNQQYVDNLFKTNAHIVFNLNSGINNFSPIPVIQFSGIPIFLLTALFLFNLRKSKLGLAIPTSVLLISTIVLVYYDKLADFYFVLFILPIISLGIFSIKRIEPKILPFLVIPVVFFVGLSLVPIFDPVNMAAILISLPLLFAIFCTRLIPFLLKKTKSLLLIKKSNYIILAIILIVIISNIGFSYKLESMTMYQDYEIGTVSDEIQKFFETKESKITFEINQISHLLSNELNINEKYIMSNTYTVPYNIKSNNIHTSFRENVSSKSIEEFLLRESWSTFDIMYSNHYNVPPDRKNLNHPMPDYVVYIQFQRADETPWIIKALDDSQDSKFEKIYQSDQTKTMVFKINNP
jgi:4-amino-4-deoxy-L-arabinose transferase-like glycosyltransferase